MRHASDLIPVFLFIGVAFVLFTSISDVPMQLRRHLPGFMLALSGTASAQSSGSGLDSQIDAQWHAPNKNFWDQSVDKTINAEGTYGFIFNSSKDPRGVTYGDYNYCNMPHVRKQEYKKPSREYELEYVEVIHRHHKRTPYDSNLVSASFIRKGHEANHQLTPSSSRTRRRRTIAAR